MYSRDLRRGNFKWFKEMGKCQCPVTGILLLAALAVICFTSKLWELLITQHPIPSPLYTNADIFISVPKLSSNCFLQRVSQKSVFKLNVPKQYACFLGILSSALTGEEALSLY